MLTKGSWKASKRQPQKFPVRSLNDEVFVKPISARRRGQIDQRFATDAEGKLVDRNGYAAAFICEMVVDEAGQPLFTEDEVFAEDFDDAVFQELSRIVGGFLGVGGDAKNP
jgi:hypothetical protein